MKNRKLKNLNMSNLVILICILLPITYVMFNILCRAISMSGVTIDSNFDFMALFTSSASQFTNVEIFGLSGLNDWLYTYVFKNVSNSGMLVVKFAVWYIEYFIALECLNIVLQFFLIIPNIIQKYFGGK